MKLVINKRKISWACQKLKKSNYLEQIEIQKFNTNLKILNLVKMKDKGLNSWENFSKQILGFLDTIPNHLRIQIDTKFFDGPVPKNQETFDSGMAEFSNQFHVIAYSRTQSH